jgi:ZIP family zinc transporter
MIAASVWSLLLPGIEEANENQQISWLITSGGFLLGVIMLLVTDYALKQKYRKMQQKKQKLPLSKKTAMLVLSITIHNIPEGMAIGMAFALAANKASDANLFSGAVALALGIGIQNYPEGMAVALPLLQDGIGKKKAFLIGTLSAAVEPIFSVVAAVLVNMVGAVMPLLLSFAAGTMIYVVVEELIPEAHLGEKENIGTLGFIVGFLVMMILDVALG